MKSPHTHSFVRSLQKLVFTPSNAHTITLTLTQTHIFQQIFLLTLFRVLEKALFSKSVFLKTPIQSAVFHEKFH